MNLFFRATAIVFLATIVSQLGCSDPDPATSKDVPEVAVKSPDARVPATGNSDAPVEPTGETANGKTENPVVDRVPSERTNLHETSGRNETGSVDSQPVEMEAGNSSKESNGDAGSEPESPSVKSESKPAKKPFKLEFVEATGKEGLNPGDTIPNFEGEDIDGIDFQLADYQGKVIMLDFWGDW